MSGVTSPLGRVSKKRDNDMKELYKKYKDLLSLDGLNIHNVIELISAWMFGLVGFGAWLIVTLIGRNMKK